MQGDVRDDGPVRLDLRATRDKPGVRYKEAGIVEQDIPSLAHLMTQLTQVDVVVSPRFHNLILGLMLNKPVIAISYDPRDDGWATEWDWGKCGQLLGDLNAVRAAIFQTSSFCLSPAQSLI